MKIYLLWASCAATLGTSGWLFARSMALALPPVAPVRFEASVLLENASRSFGGPDAKWRVVEFIDYECPPCRHSDQRARELYRKRDDVAWYVRHFPLSFHSSAEPLARLALGAGKNGDFAKAHAFLMDNQALSYKDKLRILSRDLGVSSDAIEKEAASADTKALLEKDKERGERLRLTGTPSIFLIDPEGNVWKGSQIEQIERVIR